MKIAADKCIYSNHNFVMKKIGTPTQQRTEAQQIAKTEEQKTVDAVIQPS